MYPNFNPILENAKNPLLDQFIINALSCNIFSGYPYFHFIDIQNFFPRLLLSFSKIPKNSKTIFPLWIIQCYFNRFINESSNEKNMKFFSDIFGNNSLATSTDPSCKVVYEFILKINDLYSKIDNNQSKVFLDNLLLIHEKFPEIFYSEYSLFLEMLNAISPQTIQNIIGLQSINLYFDPPPILLDQLNIVIPNMKASDLMILFSSPIIFKNFDFTHLIQKQIEISNPFPIKISGVKSPTHFTCVNTCIIHKIHFFDLWNSEVVKHLQSKQYKLVSSTTNTFPRASPFFLIANNNLVFDDLSNIVKYDILTQADYPSSSASELCIRLYNDQKILEHFQEITKDQELSFDKMKQFSIPFLLQDFLDYSDILTFSNKLYYVFSDDETTIDFDFIRCYKAITLFLDSMKISSTEPNHSIFVKKNLDEITSLVNGIKYNSVKKALLTDLFSLIFLKSKNDGKIICSNKNKVAETIAKLAAKELEYPEMVNASKLLVPSKNLNLNIKSLLRLNIISTKDSKEPNDLLYKSSDILFSAIEKKDWTKADCLSRNNTYYHKLVLLAHSISALINNEGIPEEAQLYMKLLNIELGMSVPSMLNCLHQSISNYPEYASLINNRIQKNEHILNPLNEEKWNDLSEFDLNSQTISLIQLENISQKLEKNKNAMHITKFIEYFKYLGPIIEKDNASFSISEALSKWSKESEKFAKYINVDLFLKIISQKDFSANNDFIDYYIGQYPYELYTYSACTSMESTPAIIKSFYNSIDDQQSDDVNEIVNNIIQCAISNEDIDKVCDEYLYQVDPINVYNKLMEFSNKQFNLSMIKLLDLVSYIAPEEDFSRIQELKLQHQFILHNIQNPSNLDEIINQFPFEQIIQISRTYTELIPQVFSFCNSTQDNFQKEERFSIFINVFMKTPILTQYTDKQLSLLPLLLKYGPIQLRQYFSTLKELTNNPYFIHDNDEWKLTNISFFEPGSLLDFIKLNPKYSLVISNHQKAFFSDSYLIDIAKSQINNFDVIKHIHSILDQKSSKNTLLKIYKTHLTELIQKIRVSDLDSQLNAISTISTYQSTLTQLKSSNLKYQAILSFLLHCPTSLFTPSNIIGLKVILNFNNFDKSSFGYDLLLLCYLFDMHSNASEIIYAYSLNPTQYYLNYAYLQVSLHLFHEARDVFNEHKSLSSLLPELFVPYKKYCSNNEQNAKIINLPDFKLPFYDISTLFFVPFVTAEIFPDTFIKSILQIPKEDIHKSKLEFISIYQTILKTNKVTKDNELADELLYYLTNFSNKAAAISILVSNNLLNQAFQLLSDYLNSQTPEISRNKNIINDPKGLFIWNFFYPILSTKNKQTFFAFFKSSEFIETCAPLWNNAILEMKYQNLQQGRILIYNLLGQDEDLSLLLLSTFHETKTFSKKILVIAQVEMSLHSAIMKKKSDQSQNPKGKTMEELMELQKSVFIQKIALEMCIKYKFDDSKSDHYDLWTSDEGAANVCSMFMINGEKEDVLVEILKFIGVSNNNLYRSITDYLITFEEKEIQNKIKKMKTLYPLFFTELSHELLSKLASSSKWDYIMNLIPVIENDRHSQIGLFIEYNFIGEAFNFSELCHDYDLLPIIGFKASLLGNTGVVQDCERLQSKLLH